MARNIDDIQRDIERTRRQLASTLDELADRSKQLIWPMTLRQRQLKSFHSRTCKSLWRLLRHWSSVQLHLALPVLVARATT